MNLIKNLKFYQRKIRKIKFEVLSKKNQKDLKELKDELFFNAKMIFKGYF